MFTQFVYLLGIIAICVSLTTIIVMICRVLIAKAEAEKAVSEAHYHFQIEQVRHGEFEYHDRCLPPGGDFE